MDIMFIADAIRIANDDGFNNLNDFYDFFESRYGLPFEGILIKWNEEWKLTKKVAGKHYIEDE